MGEENGIVVVDDYAHHPTEVSATIDAAFQKANLNVNLSFVVLTTTWNCGWRVPGYKQIKIINIKKVMFLVAAKQAWILPDGNRPFAFVPAWYSFLWRELSFLSH